MGWFSTSFAGDITRKWGKIELRSQLTTSHYIRVFDVKDDLERPSTVNCKNAHAISEAYSNLLQAQRSAHVF